ncbi:glycosyl hydrolase family 28-related protein [Azohydromonas aeria]|uniref:glycosyl hydrolase family 28-related protein n=1 Tax=Azohydromonas aeria TaxID=2590212 RepID=UPI0012FA21BA|nr:glycosyl hydrolase family 28-related protein [Azohydromonas aeria]
MKRASVAVMPCAGSPMGRLGLVLVLVLALLLSLGLSRPAAAEELPPDSNIVNVRNFGARGDGIHDDTGAIRAAIAAARTQHGTVFWPARIVYFPAGTYRITDTLASRDAQGLYQHSMSLVGESAYSVRLRLADKAAGFGNAQQPKAMIFTSSGLRAGSPTAGGKDYINKGEGNDAYGNYIEDLTIDVGSGNPGAVALDYIASNVGAVRRVRLVAPPGSGHTALSMERRWPGPLLVSDVSIDGFARGVAVRHREYGVTLQRLVLRGQTEVAIRNEGNVVSMHDVTISGSPLALANTAPEGLVVAQQLNVTVPAGSTGGWLANQGYVLLGQAALQGVTASSRLAGGLAAATAGAYFGAQRLSNFSAAATLPALAAPVWTPQQARWANVVRYGAKPDSGEDATPAIRAAMASGAEVVYFPSGKYVISDAIEVPQQVRRVVGMFSSFTIGRRAARFTPETGMFRVTGTGEPLSIERVALDNAGRGPQLGVEHVGARTLVLQDLITYGVQAVLRGASGGRLFIENTCCGSMRFQGSAGIWARQLDTEGPNVRIANQSAPLWILGLKTEQNATIIENGAGARTEVLGGLLYVVNAPVPALPAFINQPSGRMFLAYAESAYLADRVYAVHISQPGGPTLRAAQLPARTLARMVPGVTWPPPPAVPATTSTSQESTR